MGKARQQRRAAKAANRRARRARVKELGRQFDADQRSRWSALSRGTDAEGAPTDLK